MSSRTPRVDWEYVSAGGMLAKRSGRREAAGGGSVLGVSEGATARGGGSRQAGATLALAPEELLSKSRVRTSSYGGLSPRASLGGSSFSSVSRFDGQDADVLDVRSHSRLSQTRQASRELEKVIGDFQPSSLARRGPTGSAELAESISAGITQRWAERDREAEAKRKAQAAAAPPLVTSDAAGTAPENQDFVQPVLDQVYDAVSRMQDSDLSLSEILSTTLRRTIQEAVVGIESKAKAAQQAQETAEWLVAQKGSELEALSRTYALERERSNAASHELQLQIQSLQADLVAARARETELLAALDNRASEKQDLEADNALLKSQNEQLAAQQQQLAASRSDAIASRAKLRAELDRIAGLKAPAAKVGNLDSARAELGHEEYAEQKKCKEQKEVAQVRDDVRAVFTTNQNAQELLQQWDSDASGVVDITQFRDAIRNGATVSADEISDASLLTLFKAVDDSQGGTGSVSIESLSTIISGGPLPAEQRGSTQEPAADHRTHSSSTSAVDIESSHDDCEPSQALEDFDKVAQQQEDMLRSLAESSAAQNAALSEIAKESAAANDKIASQREADNAKNSEDLSGVRSELQEALLATPHEELAQSHANLTLELQQVNHQLVDLQALHEANAKELLAKNQEVAELLTVIESVVVHGEKPQVIASSATGKSELDRIAGLKAPAAKVGNLDSALAELGHEEYAEQKEVAQVRDDVRAVFTTNQNAQELLQQWDSDASGVVDITQFRDAIRNGATVSADEISDASLLTLFKAVDDSQGGTGSVSIESLSTIISGGPLLAGKVEEDMSGTPRDERGASDAGVAVHTALENGNLAQPLPDQDRTVDSPDGFVSGAGITRPRDRGRVAELEAQLSVLQKLASSQKAEIGRLSKLLRVNPEQNPVDAVQLMIDAEQSGMEVRNWAWAEQESAVKSKERAQDAACTTEANAITASPAVSDETAGKDGSTSSQKALAVGDALGPPPSHPPPLRRSKSERISESTLDATNGTESLQDRSHQQCPNDAQDPQMQDEYIRLIEEARTEAAAHREAAASHQEDASKHKSEMSELRRQLEDVESRHQDVCQTKDGYLRQIEEARTEAAAHREAAASHQEDASKHKSELSELRRQLEDVESRHQDVCQTKDGYLRQIEEARTEAAAHREAAASHQEDASKHKSELSELRRQLEDVESRYQNVQQESAALAEQHAAAHAAMRKQTARAETAEEELMRTREAERSAAAEVERVNIRLNRTQAELTEASRNFRDEKRKLDEAHELQRITERQKEAVEKQQEQTVAALTTLEVQLEETEANAAAAATRAADDAATAAMAVSESKHRETTLEMDLGATRVTLSRAEESLTETQAREASLRTERDQLADSLAAANETKEMAVEEARTIREEWQHYSQRLAEAQASAAEFKDKFHLERERRVKAEQDITEVRRDARTEMLLFGVQSIATKSVQEDGSTARTGRSVSGFESPSSTSTQSRSARAKPSPTAGGMR